MPERLLTIQQLELSPADAPLPAKMNLTYYLGEQDALWQAHQRGK